MVFENLKQEWKDSLSFFKKDNLLLFTSKTFSLFKSAIWVFLKKFWWFIPIFVLLNWFVSNRFTDIGIFANITLFSILLIPFLFIIILIVHDPSKLKMTIPFLIGSLIFLFITSTLYLVPLYTMCVFFYLDSQPTLSGFFSSFINGIKFVIRYLPILIILQLSFIVFSLLFTSFMSLLSVMIFNESFFGLLVWFIGIFLAFFFTSFLSVFYHENKQTVL